MIYEYDLWIWSGDFAVVNHAKMKMLWKQTTEDCDLYSVLGIAF